MHPEAAAIQFVGENALGLSARDVNLVQAQPHARRAGADAALDRCRACYGHHAWTDTYKALTLIDRSATLSAEDLNLSALSTDMNGDDDAYLKALIAQAKIVHTFSGSVSVVDKTYVVASRCLVLVGIAAIFSSTCTGTTIAGSPHEAAAPALSYSRVMPLTVPRATGDMAGHRECLAC